ncbi:MAG: winged helix DNA-binding domain-containing protein [Nonomuraea sp.]|nr:winged helix DNA-binding domain-containing protein [Nonomuraea sp.]
MRTFTWDEVSARRLARQGLAEPAAGDVAGTVAAMCGAHAQVMPAAEVSIGIRLSCATRADVRRALWQERELVKTHGPRGTVHLLATRDLPMWVGALSTLPVTNPHAADIRLNERQVGEVVSAIADACQGAELTIDELSEEVVARTGPWAGELVMPAFQTMWPRWRQAMAQAAHRGAFVFGPNRGRRVTYTAPPAFAPLSDSRAELVRHYLRAYGPATPEHFARWVGAPRPWAVAAFGLVELEEVLLEGSAAYVLAGDTADEGNCGGVRLLPYFDAYAVAGMPRELLFPGAAAQRALNRGQAGNFPVLLVDGRVAGVWHQRRSGSKLEVRVETLWPVDTALIEEQVVRLGEIQEARANLTLGEVTVGAHA